MLKATVRHTVDFNVIPQMKECIAQEGLGDDLLPPSPLTTPESSPSATPESSPMSTLVMKSAELPAEQLQPAQATDTSTAQERLKRRRKRQGRNNRAKRQCNVFSSVVRSQAKKMVSLQQRF